MAWFMVRAPPSIVWSLAALELRSGRLTSMGRRAASEILRIRATMIQLASKEEPPAARNGVVSPVNGNEPRDSTNDDEALQGDGKRQTHRQKLAESIAGTQGGPESPGDK